MGKKAALDKIYDGIKEYIHYDFGQYKFNSQHPRIRLHEPSFNEKEIYGVVNQLLETDITLKKGGKVELFEKEFAKKFGSKYAIMVNSGSSANLLAIASLCVPFGPMLLKKGDEVII